jgi:hypothetical protein
MFGVAAVLTMALLPKNGCFDQLRLSTGRPGIRHCRPDFEEIRNV